MVEPHNSNFRVITTNFLGVRIFRKFPKYSDAPKICCNDPKSWTRWHFLRVMHPKDAEEIANSLGAFWSGSTLFAQTCLSVRKLRKFTVYFQVIRRRIVLPASLENETPPLKVTLAKRTRKDGRWIVRMQNCKQVVAKITVGTLRSVNCTGKRDNAGILPTTLNKTGMIEMFEILNNNVLLCQFHIVEYWKKKN